MATRVYRYPTPEYSLCVARQLIFASSMNTTARFTKLIEQQLTLLATLADNPRIYQIAKDATEKQDFSYIMQVALFLDSERSRSDRVHTKTSFIKLAVVVQVLAEMDLPLPTKYLVLEGLRTSQGDTLLGISTDAHIAPAPVLVHHN